jgi:hypothetical protein
VQRIEGFNVADLGWGTASAQAVTLSFWVRSSLTGTFGGAINNSGANRSYPFTYSISSANTWEQKTITVAGDTTGTWLTTNGIGIAIWFGLGVGSSLSGTAGAWASSGLYSATGATSVVGTNGATFYITGVQLEKGSQATAFEWRPYGTELALCQRYFQRYNYIVDIHGSGLGASTYTPVNAIVLPVPMRATPTVTTSNFIVLAGNTTASAFASGFDAAIVTTYLNKGANAWTSGSNTCTYTINANIEL